MATYNPTAVVETLNTLGVEAAILSTTPDVTRATGWAPGWEMWPGYNPYVPEPVVACAWPDKPPILLLPDYYAPYAPDVPGEVQLFSTYSYLDALDQVANSAEAIVAQVGGAVRRLGYQGRTLPTQLREKVGMRIDVEEWIDVSEGLERARMFKTEEEIEALRTACAAADLVQEKVKELAAPGMREIDLANGAITAAWGRFGHRFAILMQLGAGEATAALGGWEPRDREIHEGDLVCCDTAPWLGGVFGDSCNAVVVGVPDRDQLRMADLVQASLDAGLAVVRPGLPARELDLACRQVIADAGLDYAHHTGHGIGYSHTEPPRVTPTSDDTLDEGMVLCIEPGIYLPGRWGFRREHQFVVRSDGPELLTQFDHRL